MNKYAFNPYLPSFEYIPDGEPHLFNKRIYIYGSHDAFNAADYCINDYVCWSASEEDLTSWRYEGIIYTKMQDPRNINKNIAHHYEYPDFFLKRRKKMNESGITLVNPKGIHAMWAPDVTFGPDGRYYLYYCLDYMPEIAVAVCDSPAGEYEFYGFVRHKDGRILGTGEDDAQFDPAIFVDDDNRIFLYSGNADARIKTDDKKKDKSAAVFELEIDMLTIKEDFGYIVPNVYNSIGTGFENHEFFEASSMRKFNGKYYFIYSSIQSCELCYAISNSPYKNFEYGGKIIDIGDCDYKNRLKQDAVNVLGNTHGSIVKINENYYVFYHRHTNRTDYSRQGCAERILINNDGSINQTEVTSCGLNSTELSGCDLYPARICCHITSPYGMSRSGPGSMKMNYPYLKQDIEDISPEHPRAVEELNGGRPVQYVSNIINGCIVGYKYFNLLETKTILITYRGTCKGRLSVYYDTSGNEKGFVDISESIEYNSVLIKIESGEKKSALYFKFIGNGYLDLLEFKLGK